MEITYNGDNFGWGDGIDHGTGAGNGTGCAEALKIREGRFFFGGEIYGDGDGFGFGNGDGEGEYWRGERVRFLDLLMTNRSFDGHLINLYLVAAI